MAAETKQLGQIIKNLRKEHHLSGEDLGKKAGLSQSKISKIETGYYPYINPKEIENILNILECPKTIRQQVDRLLTEIEPSTTLKRPYSLPQKLGAQVGKQAKSIVMFAYNSIPCIFQTYAYREASVLRYGRPPEEMQLFIKDMLERQELLWDKERSYHVILHQAALYTCPVSKGQQLAQLDRLQTMMDLPNVKVGILPVEAGLSLIENSNFVIYDRKWLFLCLAKGDVETQDIEDITIHLRVFAELEYLAHYSDEAKNLVRKAMEYFMYPNRLS